MEGEFPSDAELSLRYDLQFLKSIATDTNNVSPRGEACGTPRRAGQPCAAAMLFYDRIPLRALANARLSSANTTNLTSTSQISIGLSPTQAGAPVFPNILNSVVTGVLVGFHHESEYAERLPGAGRLRDRTAVGSSSTLSVGYQHVRACI